MERPNKTFISAQPAVRESITLTHIMAEHLISSISLFFSTNLINSWDITILSTNIQSKLNPTNLQFAIPNWYQTAIHCNRKMFTTKLFRASKLEDGSSYMLGTPSTKFFTGLFGNFPQHSWGRILGWNTLTNVTLLVWQS